MNLSSEHCREVGPEERIEPQEAMEHYVNLLDEGWAIDPALNILRKQFDFSGYEEVMIFTNFVAWLSAQQNHHPRLILEYKTCIVEYQTHSASGLSINDFICAAHIDHYLSRP
jgi:4a-hydroxytetrahydrobiopterin dehydratase